MIHFEHILENILTVALSETDGHDVDNSLTPSEVSQAKLIECIATGEIQFDTECNDNAYKGIEEEHFFIADHNTLHNDESDIHQWVNNILTSSKNKASIKGDRLNGYYCPSFVNRLLAISYEFPLWTSVMVKHFGSPNTRGTSARIEGYFASLKTSIICQKLPKMRVDKFLVTHLRALRGDIKLSQSHVDNKSSKCTSYKNSNVLEKKQIQRNITSKYLENNSRIGPNIDPKDKIMKNKNEKMYTLNDNDNIRIITEDPDFFDQQTKTKKRKSLVDYLSSSSQTDTDKCDEENNNQKYFKPIDEEPKDLVTVNQIKKKDNFDNTNSALQSDSNTSDDDENYENIKIESGNNGEEPEELILENWKNKAVPTRRKFLYLEEHPEMRFQSEAFKIKHKHKNIDLARNGNLIRPISLGKNKVRVLNTCAVDAILQILATGMVDYVHYANFAMSTTCSILKLAHKLAKNGTDQDFYKNRILVVQEYAKKNIRQTNIIEYDAQANTNVLVEKLFNSEPSINQFNTCSNPKCRQTISGLELFPINLLKLYKGNFYLFYAYF